MDAHARHRPNRTGALADYIPELDAGRSRGVWHRHRHGRRRSARRRRQPKSPSPSSRFRRRSSIASRSNCAVARRCSAQVGVEPSGDAFNAIVFDPRTNRPFNPMVNAGAITVDRPRARACSATRAFERDPRALLEAAGPDAAHRRSGLSLRSDTGHRNRAIGYLLRNVGAVRAPVERALDLYFRQCSILVNAARPRTHGGDARERRRRTR